MLDAHHGILQTHLGNVPVKLLYSENQFQQFHKLVLRQVILTSHNEGRSAVLKSSIESVLSVNQIN